MLDHPLEYRRHRMMRFVNDDVIVMPAVQLCIMACHIGKSPDLHAVPVLLQSFRRPAFPVVGDRLVGREDQHTEILRCKGSDVLFHDLALAAGCRKNDKKGGFSLCPCLCDLFQAVLLVLVQCKASVHHQSVWCKAFAAASQKTSDVVLDPLFKPAVLGGKAVQLDPPPGAEILLVKLPAIPLHADDLWMMIGDPVLFNRHITLRCVDQIIQKITPALKIRNAELLVQILQAVRSVHAGKILLKEHFQRRSIRIVRPVCRMQENIRLLPELFRQGLWGNIRAFR